MSTKKAKKVSVSLRALTQRINRKLAKDNQVLHAVRAPGMGDAPYYVVDVRRNTVAAEITDIEKLGRDEGALRPWEALDV